jgi:hypothetical protein
MKDTKNKIIEKLPIHHKIRLAKNEKAKNESKVEIPEDLEYDSKYEELITSLIGNDAYYDQFERRTRNLSIKVQNKLSVKKKPFNFKRMLIPAAAVIIFVVMFSNGYFDKKSSDSDSITNIKSNEVAALVDNDNYEDIINETLVNNSVMNINQLDNDEVDHSINNEISDNLIDTISDNDGKFSNDFNETDIMNNLNNLDEQQFQVLIEELENAKIIN